jgi:hypothetical protein
MGSDTLAEVGPSAWRERPSRRPKHSTTLKEKDVKRTWCEKTAFEGPPADASGPLKNRISKPKIGDGETRNRTEDTTIFR